MCFTHNKIAITAASRNSTRKFVTTFLHLKDNLFLERLNFAPVTLSNKRKPVRFPARETSEIL